MFFATNAAPRFLAVNGDSCLYSVPIRMRSSLSNTGQLIAPGIWSSANSAGERVSIMQSNVLSWVLSNAGKSLAELPAPCAAILAQYFQDGFRPGH